MHLGDKSVVQAMEAIFIVVEATLKSRINQICIRYVFHVPKLHANWQSVSKLVSNGLKVQFNQYRCI